MPKPKKELPLAARLKKAEAELAKLRAAAGIKVNPDSLARSRVKTMNPAERRRHAQAFDSLFRPAVHPTKTLDGLPPGERMEDQKFALDAGGWGGPSFGQQALWSAYAEGQEFLGYPTLALMAQRGEYRTIVRALANAMTRKWIKIKSGKDDGSSQGKINDLDRYMKKLRVRQHFKRAAELDFYFGRGHLFLEFGGTAKGTDPDETKHTVGWGDDEQTREKVGKNNRLTAIRPIEPVWTYPMSYNTNDPLSPQWYLPETWFVLGKQIHSTRLLRFVIDEVSDLLKPAYSFGGLSKTQIAKPYVDNWLNARQSVADILKGFTTYVLSTNLMATLRNGTAQDLYERIEIFVNMRDNNGVMAIDKDQESFFNINTPLSGLSQLQSQSLEFICCISQLPMVYFTGITPSGLNPSSRDEMMVFNETIKSMQEAEFESNLRSVFHHCQMSLWDEVDDDLDFEFVPIMEMTEIERSQKNLVDAQVKQSYVEMQAVQPAEVREGLATDPDSPFPGLAIEQDDPDEQDEPNNDPWTRWVRMETEEEKGQVKDPFEKVALLAGEEVKDDGPWDNLKALARDAADLKPKHLEHNFKMAPDPGYAYHVTNHERLHNIADSGQLKTYKPSEFTDQSSWPDGSIKKRSYFAPSVATMFAPEAGHTVALRTKMGPHIKAEKGTGDLYTEKPISTHSLEYLHHSGEWRPIVNKYTTEDSSGKIEAQDPFTNLKLMARDPDPTGPWENLKALAQDAKGEWRADNEFMPDHELIKTDQTRKLPKSFVHHSNSAETPKISNQSNRLIPNSLSLADKRSASNMWGEHRHEYTLHPKAKILHVDVGGKTGDFYNFGPGLAKPKDRGKHLHDYAKKNGYHGVYMTHVPVAGNELAMFSTKHLIPSKGQAQDEFNESDHPRAPDGKFGSGGGSHQMKEVSGRKGSNPGGLYKNANQATEGKVKEERAVLPPAPEIPLNITVQDMGDLRDIWYGIKLTGGNWEKQQLATLLVHLKNYGGLPISVAKIKKKLEESYKISKVAGKTVLQDKAELIKAKAIAIAQATEGKSGRWKLVSGRKGSNPGGLYKDDNGQHHYVKFYANTQQAHVEQLASHLFEQLGAKTPSPRVAKVNGNEALITRWNDNLKRVSPAQFGKLNEKQQEQIAKMFMGAVLTKNWDVVGSGYDNIVRDKTTGDMVEVDTGGAFHFRAQGSPKPYGPDIAEFESLRNPDHPAGQVFNKLFKQNPQAVQSAIEAVQNLNMTSITKDFEASGLENQKELLIAFKARRKALLAKFNKQAADSFYRRLIGLDEFVEYEHPRNKDGKFSSVPYQGVKELKKWHGPPKTKGAPFMVGSQVGYQQVHNGIGHKLDSIPAKIVNQMLENEGGLIPAAEIAQKQYGNVEEKTVTQMLAHMNNIKKGFEKGSLAAQGLTLLKHKWGGKLYYGIKDMGPTGKKEESAARTPSDIEPPADATFKVPLMKITALDLEDLRDIWYESKLTGGDWEKQQLATLLVHLQNRHWLTSVIKIKKKLEESYEISKVAGKTVLQDMDELINVKAIAIAQAQATEGKVSPAPEDKVNSAQLSKPSLREQLEDHYMNSSFTPEVKAAHIRLAESLAGLKHDETWGKSASELASEAGYYYNKGEGKVAGTSLTPEEGAYVYMYTGRSYAPLNKQLRQGKLAKGTWEFVKGLNKALDKLPTYTGDVVRGTSIDPSVYEVGMIIEERGFTSTSYESGFEGDVTYKIKSRTGKKVSHLSASPSESEVLFRAGSRFEVMAITKNDDQTVIHMDEVEHE
jgi:uncharacterized protein